MEQDLIAFLKSDFKYLFSILILAFMLVKGMQIRKEFPPVSKNAIIFSAGFISGYATSSYRARFGGARNSLQVTITEDELRITTWIFFAWIARRNDLIHRIPLTDIYETELDENRLTARLHIRFRKNGTNREIVLKDRKAPKIKSVLDEVRTRQHP